MTEIRELINNALHLHTERLKSDDFTKYSVYDELSNYLVNALNMLDMLDKIEDTKNTREIVYLKSEYRYSDIEQRMFLACHYAHSLHELSESHIYEVTMQRAISERDNHNIDYVHKAIIIADFDYNNNVNKDFKNDFQDEVFDALFDVRFDTVSASIKQLS
jgi:hypothetical protein